MKSLADALRRSGEEQQRQYPGEPLMSSDMKAILKAVMKKIFISRASVMMLGLVLPLWLIAGELPKVREDYLARYRSMAKYESPRMKYVLIRADSREAYVSETVPTIYLLDIQTKSPNNVFYSPEIDQLIREEFVLDIHYRSLLSYGKTDYIVMSMARPAAIDPDYTRCWDRSEVEIAYLFSINDGKVKIIDKTFGGCGTYYEVIKEGKTVGYGVTREDFDGTITTDRYLLRRGAIVKLPGLPKRDVPE